MALQDLTPQLRTRISRVERLVGLFVFVAALLMLGAFAYYLRDRAEQRGWFKKKVPYYCFLKSATGLAEGDPVVMLGRTVGRIRKIETAQADQWFLDNEYYVFVKFEIDQPYYGYIFTDSKVRVQAIDLFSTRRLEVLRGDPNVGLVTVIEKPRWEDWTIRSDKDQDKMILLSKSKDGFWLKAEEAPAVTARAEAIVRTISESLPVITSQLTQTLVQATAASSNAAVLLADMRPAITNLQTLTARLQNEEGAIGRMLLTTNLQTQVEGTMASMQSTLTNTTELIRTSERELQELTRRIALTLDNVTLVTSNLSGQVSANSFLLGEVSSLVVGADDMLQGLKRHWLLRSAFTDSTNAPLESVVGPTLDLPRPR